MFAEANQFRDIDAALGNPWWPLAPGWWLLLAGLVLLALALWRFDLVWRLRLPIPMVTLGSWRWEAGRELRRLRRDATSASIKHSAAELSELLRRIAMARHGRGACAGLHGTDWLGWLATHDPKGFDWLGRGKLLLNAPYAPAARAETERAVLIGLIDAAMEWVVAGDPKPARASSRHPAARVISKLKAQLARLPKRRRSLPVANSSGAEINIASSSAADATGAHKAS